MTAKEFIYKEMVQYFPDTDIEITETFTAGKTTTKLIIQAKGDYLYNKIIDINNFNTKEVVRDIISCIFKEWHGSGAIRNALAWND